MNTSYDDIIDLALISIEDYRLNIIANQYVTEGNYNLILSSTDYDNYVTSCSTSNPIIQAVTQSVYNSIRNASYASYNDYVDASESAFKTIMDGFLIRAIPNFDNCTKDLSDRDDVTRTFNVSLSDQEKGILADYVALMWLDKEINDARQIIGMLQNNNESHRYSEANNMNAKRERRMQIYEDVGQKKTKYSFSNAPWKDWANGKYEL